MDEKRREAMNFLTQDLATRYAEDHDQRVRLTCLQSASRCVQGQVEHNTDKMLVLDIADSFYRWVVSGRVV